MKVLELFSGTHSIGVVAKKLNYDVVSLDRDLDAKSTMYDYTSPHHIKCDIMTWDYKKDFKKGDFYIITASPVCAVWSCLKNCWIGRKLKNGTIGSKATIQNDIDLYGKPMVDKVFEIIEYFKPKYYWIENPISSSMWNYIKTKWDFDDDEKFHKVDYCKYSNWGYKKPTIFLTNINVNFMRCKNDCENMKEDTNYHIDKCANITYYKKPCGEIVRLRTKELRAEAEKNCWIKLTNKHQQDVSITVGGGNNRLERYRIPSLLIEELFKNCIINYA